jgi:predicted metalloprotease with PDZ domain
LGIRVKAEGSALKLANVLDGGSAQLAGLSAGDELIALNGLRVSPSNLESLIGRESAGDVLKILVFRRDELLSFEVSLRAPVLEECALKIADRQVAGADRLREAWLLR